MTFRWGTTGWRGTGMGWDTRYGATVCAVDTPALTQPRSLPPGYSSHAGEGAKGAAREARGRRAGSVEGPALEQPRPGIAPETMMRHSVTVGRGGGGGEFC